MIKSGDLNAHIGNAADEFMFLQTANSYGKFKFEQTSEYNLKIINMLSEADAAML